jgi:hypothetical protein
MNIEDVVVRAYQAVTDADAAAFTQLFAPDPLRQYFERTRADSEDQEELAMLLRFGGLESPDISTLNNDELMRLILLALPIEDRRQMPIDIRIVYTDLPRATITLHVVDLECTDEVSHDLSPVQRDDDLSRLLSSAQDVNNALEVERHDNGWLIVPLPFGLIPIPGYAGTAMWFEVDGDDVDHDAG